MGTYLLRRLLLMVPTMLGIIVLSFLIMKLAPGDPASLKFAASGQGAGLDAQRGTEQAIEKFRERYALDRPLPVQFGYFLKRLFTLDLIYFQWSTTIWDRFLPALWVTLQLNLIVIVLTYLIAVPLGIFSAAYPRARLDSLVTIGLFVLYSLPSFWVADLLRIWFGSPDSWIRFPILGLRSDGYHLMSTGERFLDYVHHLVLPVFCLTYGLLAYLSRQMRAGMLEVMRQDYIRTAEAKGASKTRVILVHALRNGLFPVITLFATVLPFLIGGNVIIEYVFNIPGMGRLAYHAVLMREYDAAMATLIVSALLTLAGILVSDLLYVVVNPRVSLEGRR
ncbi:MAG: ABC transporter permease [Planctomycetaceae bacterium]